MRVHFGKSVLILGSILWFVVGTAVFADIVTVKPHPHGDDYVWFEEDGTKNGDDDHNHVFAHTVQGNAGAGHNHDAFAVWNNRTFNYDLGSATFAPGLKADFWHGFIEAGNEPRYKFIDGAGANTAFDNTSKGIISDGVAEWVTKATAAAAARTTPNGSPLETGIGFVSTAGANYEIQIGFFDNLIEQRGALAEVLVSDEQIWTGSGIVPADLDGRMIIAFDDDTNWLFDTGLTPTAAQTDFFTIALHELGHAFGLLHSPVDQVGNVMRASIANQATNGSTLRSVDSLGSANGAAELYSQPAVPEPSAIAVFSFGTILLGVRLLKNRRRDASDAICAGPSQSGTIAN